MSIACELLECGEEEEDNHCLFSGSHLVILLPATLDQHGRQGGRHEQGGRHQQGGRDQQGGRHHSFPEVRSRKGTESGLQSTSI